MRARGSLLILCLVSLGANYAFAQAAEDPPLQFDPYNKHHDRHLGHNHVYPDRGAVFRDAPKGSTTVNFAGLAYRFYNGVWFEPRGPAYIVVMPPIGVVVPSLPSFATSFQSRGETYLYANETYYLPRPDLGGYEVVNDPADDVQAATAKTGTGRPLVKPVSVAPTPAAPPVSGAPQIASIPTNPEETADAEVKAFSYAPDSVTAQSAQNTAVNAAAVHRHAATPGAAGAAVAPAMAGAALAAAPAVAGAQAAAGPSAVFGVPATVAPSVAVNSAAIAAAPSAAATGAPAIAPAPAVANNPAVTTAPTPSSDTASIRSGAPAGSNITNVQPAAGAPAPAPSAAGAGATWSSPPAATESTATTPRPSSPYSYASPPTLEANASNAGAPRTANATVATSAAATPPPTNTASVTTVPALASAATTGTTQTVSNTSNGGGVRFTASPRNGQSLDQQARDQYDCYRFGVAQTGFDPMSGSAPAAGRGTQADFDRARAACFEGRGYNVR